MHNEHLELRMSQRRRHSRRVATQDRRWQQAGGLMLAGGVVLAGVWLWEFRVGDAFTSAQQEAHAAYVLEELRSAESAAGSGFSSDRPTVGTAPPEGEVLGVLHIPSLGISRVIAEGTEPGVLDSSTLGVGHFSHSQMPGDFGNFALAGHRSSTFPNLKRLQLGDEIRVTTPDGVYLYAVAGAGYVVTPDAVEVVDPIPGVPFSTYAQAVERGNRTLTLATCWPDWSNTHRLIIHAEFVGWAPSGEAPAFGGPQGVRELRGRFISV